MRINGISWIYLKFLYLELNLTLVDDQTLAVWFNIYMSCQAQGLHDWWHNRVLKNKNKQIKLAYSDREVCVSYLL